MRHLKMLGLAAIASMFIMAFGGGGTASAETTELFSGVNTLSSFTEIHATLEFGSSSLIQSTTGVLTDTCTESTIDGSTSFTTASNIPVHFLDVLWGDCDFSTETAIEGNLSFTNIGSGDATLSGSNVWFQVIISSATCFYGFGSGTHLGEFDGESDRIEIDAVLNEQGTKKFLCPDTTNWTANYAVTSPANLIIGS